MRVKIKTVVDLLTSSARGWGWGKEKIGMLQLPSRAPSTLLRACFARRLIDLKKICAKATLFSMGSSIFKKKERKGLCTSYEVKVTRNC